MKNIYWQDLVKSAHVIEMEYGSFYASEPGFGRRERSLVYWTGSTAQEAVAYLNERIKKQG